MQSCKFEAAESPREEVTVQVRNDDRKVHGELAKAQDIWGTHSGLADASRASLSLLLVLPCELSLR